MKPTFQKQDNNLIWESFMGDDEFGDDFDDDLDSEDEFGDLDDEDDDGEFDDDLDSEVVMEIEPIGPVKAEEPANEENEMVYTEMKKLVEYSGRLMELVRNGELEPWMVAKLIKASDYVSDVWHSMDAKADFANTGFEQSDDLSKF